MSVLPPIAEVVPHQPPMLLLDEVVELAGDRVVCALTLRPDSLFVRDGRVRALVALEYMAQAVAAFAGLRGRAAGRPVQIGYLLGTRELLLHADFFEVGDRLLVSVVRVWGDEQFGCFECSVTTGGKVAAAATLKVYQGRGEGGPA